MYKILYKTPRIESAVQLQNIPNNFNTIKIRSDDIGNNGIVIINKDGEIINYFGTDETKKYAEYVIKAVEPHILLPSSNVKNVVVNDCQEIEPH